ncbi:hypothetical protein HYV91_01590 [Candidatus Wolfebacteria bacterium]|nr:hypothetical protein [Candidatus Wolfebacteria bacterium]
MSVNRIVLILLVIGVAGALAGSFAAPQPYNQKMKTARNRLSLMLYWGGIGLSACAGVLAYFFLS